jgi:hypothetical protein
MFAIRPSGGCLDLLFGTHVLQRGADRQTRSALRIWAAGQGHVVLGRALADANVVLQPGQPVAVPHDGLGLDQLATRISGTGRADVKVLANLDREVGQPIIGWAWRPERHDGQ